LSQLGARLCGGDVDSEIDCQGDEDQYVDAQGNYFFLGLEAERHFDVCFDFSVSINQSWIYGSSDESASP
jgi:hypothetical protein